MEAAAWTARLTLDSYSILTNDFVFSFFHFTLRTLGAIAGAVDTYDHSDSSYEYLINLAL